MKSDEKYFLFNVLAGTIIEMCLNFDKLNDKTLIEARAKLAYAKEVLAEVEGNSLIAESVEMLIDCLSEQFSARLEDFAKELLSYKGDSDARRTEPGSEDY